MSEYNQVAPCVKVYKSTILKLDTSLEIKNNFLETSCIH